jgi:hypothetical protein
MRRRCHTNLAESPNAVCLNSLGHDGDSPDPVSSDAAKAKCPCEPDLRSKPCWSKRTNAVADLFSNGFLTREFTPCDGSRRL